MAGARGEPGAALPCQCLRLHPETCLARMASEERGAASPLPVLGGGLTGGGGGRLRAGGVWLLQDGCHQPGAEAHRVLQRSQVGVTVATPQLPAQLPAQAGGAGTLLQGRCLTAAPVVSLQLPICPGEHRPSSGPRRPHWAGGGFNTLDSFKRKEQISSYQRKGV